MVSAVRSKRPSFYGEYDVVASVARGGTSRVMMAAHIPTGTRVALKVLVPEFAKHDELAARLHGELELVARASHPGLVDIYGAEHAADGTPFLVMEYLEGQTLGAISDHGPLAIETIVAVVAQAASALGALHAAGVVHCDVKPENIVVLQERVGRLPRVKVIDFGVSRTVEELAERTDPDSTIAGTPWCMAPEQWRGRPEAASDVYSLGCLLYHLLTGHAPFEGSLTELMMAHLEERPSRPSWLASMPVALERLVLRMLAKDPAHRPEMTEVAADLIMLFDALTTDFAEGTVDIPAPRFS